jgi:hypothetical protein
MRPPTGGVHRGRPGHAATRDFDEVYLQVGGNLEGAFEFFATQVLPRARGN